jgi:hypothetical protein
MVTVGFAMGLFRKKLFYLKFSEKRINHAYEPKIFLATTVFHDKKDYVKKKLHNIMVFKKKNEKINFPRKKIKVSLFCVDSTIQGSNRGLKTNQTLLFTTLVL